MRGVDKELLIAQQFAGLAVKDQFDTLAVLYSRESVAGSPQLVADGVKNLDAI
jgi:hypothetical protein